MGCRNGKHIEERSWKRKLKIFYCFHIPVASVTLPLPNVRGNFAEQARFIFLISSFDFIFVVAISPEKYFKKNAMGHIYPSIFSLKITATVGGGVKMFELALRLNKYVKAPMCLLERK